MMRGALAAIIAAVGYGFMPVLSKLLMKSQIDSQSLIVWQGAIGALLLLLIMKSRHMTLRLSRRQAKGILLIGLADGLTMFLIYESYQRIDVGLATLAHFIYPVVVTVTMAVVFRERITSGKALALVLAMGGMLIMTDIQGLNGTGIALAAASGVCYGIYNVANQKSGASEVSPLLVAFYNLVILAGAFLILRAAMGSFAGPVSTGEWIILTATGVLKVSGVCLGVYAMQTIGSTRASILSMTELVTAVAAGALVFHEVLTARQFSGGACILTAAVLIILADRSAAGGAGKRQMLGD